ncbi:MAG: hypothetical protein JWR61_5729 [Ferruginibacter sp.]|uniref:putative type IX secretion system sortase PorU2 n=1 Tax=Ferruginibacter sp. TaxID=1940288 RepID=UPI00265AA82F|nr:C25 family cysteine peptidase [Ferruginibacter sp.]MDB5280774.1 hypothetical protein [Ferruginibacter sp.]
MKKFLLPIFLLIASGTYAQLNNSWIDYSKTYFKFKVGTTGVCRISQAAVSAAGLGSIPAEQFQLWRNGEEVRLFTSVPSGTLTANDYIEFLGVKNDGKPDKNLYRDTAYQLSDSFSIHTDTSTYFLTVNPSGNNLRFQDAINNVAGNTLSPDAYFMRKVGASFKSQYNRGYAAIVGEYVYSSSYDMGEGYTSDNVSPCSGCDLYTTFNNLNVYTAGPPNSVSFYISAFGNALYTRNLKVSFYNNILFNDVPMNYFSIVKKQVNNIPLSILQSPDNLQVAVNGYTPPPGVSNSNDHIVVGEMVLTYPAKFNFNNEKNFYFELAPSSTGNYLVIDNFNAGSAPPVLYNLNTGERYTGDISAPGQVRFALPASNEPIRKFNLVNEEGNNITTIDNLTARSFINYALTANQGDYLIISNPVLFNDGNGVNYVDEYRKYRASAAGGSFHPIVLTIDELNDQFAFGIKKHPAAIRDFIRYADQQFSNKPKYVLILGRGMNSIEYKQNENDPITEKIDLVQSFGWPASDVLLACPPGQNVPLVPIGRIAAINGTEIKYYLNKVKQYEQVQASTSQTVADKAWMKNIINVAGGGDNSETDLFVNYLNDYKALAEDSAFGGHVETFIKATSSAVEQANGDRIQQLVSGGVSLIQYFGHSSANTLAFNLNSPEVYTNDSKYPFFNVSGCSAGNFFIFDPARLAGNSTLSEKWVLADQRGSIGFIASTHLGIPPFLNFFNDKFYENFALDLYGSSVGNQLKNTLQMLGGNPQALDFYTRIHLEELNLHGDPAVKINSSALPDFIVEDQLIKVSPAVISVADNNFSVSVKMMNIGKVTNDSIRVSVIRKLPNDSSKIIFNQLVPAFKYADSLTFTVPINPATDKGLNKIIVTLDVDNRVQEVSETNNTITKEFYILEDEIRPVSPYNFSIVNKQQITFSASTANPLSGQRQYVMELDTTELFNSPFKKQYTASGVGGAVEFVPNNITFTDSTVYYWRTSMIPINGAPQIWNSFSFVYLPNGGTGFNQSHYFQFLKNTFSSTIGLDSDRVFRYANKQRILTIRTGIYPFTTYERINVNLDFDQLDLFGCKYNSLQFFVYDPSTLQPWKNVKVTNPVTGEVTGRFGSVVPCLRDAASDGSRNFFEFPYNDSLKYRKRAMDFIDSIPAGMYVSITNLGMFSNTKFIDFWKADQAILGAGNTLYDKLKSMGLSKIDSFTKNIPFVFLFRKNTPVFTPQQIVGTLASDQLEPSFSLPTKYISGTIESPLFGPAQTWSSLHWRGTTNDATNSDTVSVAVYGVTAAGNQTLMATVKPATDTTLAFINATTYPYLKLKMANGDPLYATPKQLSYWRVNATYVPEGSIAPNILYTMKDSVEQGDKINFSLAFKNISTVAFDSLKVKFVITDRNNLAHPIAISKRKALMAGDTLVVSYSIDSKDYPGSNTLYIMINPDNDQPEQYLYNNFLYKVFYVKEDKFNPLLDVTFDGVHILNRDIIAAKPHILVKLKDESHFLALADTALLKLQVRFPDGNLRNYFFGDSVRFNPANLATGENTASIDFMPYFPEDGDYQLLVSGKDVVGNKAGKLQYQVTFSVINKPMISNMLNYPNPFTTSTAFVFTVTGSEVPQNIRIQILTITGKVVREITKDELGPIRIGRNITDFKWDGTDAFGQKLANGVYLYRVITNLNGKSLDKYTGTNANVDSNGKPVTVTSGLGGIDKYFNNGYGKMYLMR